MIKKVKKNEFKGIIYLLITAIIWGGSFISQLFGGKILGSFSFISIRCFIGCLTIAIMIYYDNYVRFRKFTFFVKGENKKKMIIDSFFCGFILFLSMFTQQIGVEITDIAKSGIIASLEVICVPIIMMLFFSKKIKFITWVFIILSFVGILLLGLNSLTGINRGDIWVFISTILYSITIIQVPLYIDKINPLKFSFFRFLIVAIISLIISIIFERETLSIDNIISAAPTLFYSGILASGIAYTFQILGQEYCEPVIATLLMSLEGVFAAIFGWIILGQSLNLIQIIGCIITTISICIVQITDANQVKNK